MISGQDIAVAVGPSRAQRTPRARIGAIADELGGYARAFELGRDPCCVFARAYERLSLTLAGAIDHVGFADADWIAELAQVQAT